MIENQISDAKDANPYQSNSDTLDAPLVTHSSSKATWKAALLGGVSSSVAPFGSLILTLIMGLRGGSIPTNTFVVLSMATVAMFCIGALLGIGIVTFRRAFVPDRKHDVE